MPHLTAGARSGLRNSPALASCTLGGQLAFIGLVLDVLKRYLHELKKKNKTKNQNISK